MAVKLEVEISWITNLQNLEKSMLAMNKRIAGMSKIFNKGYSILGSTEQTKQDIKTLREYDKIFDRLYQDYSKMNKLGQLGGLWTALTGRIATGDKKGTVLSAQELSEFTSMKTLDSLNSLKELEKLKEKNAEKMAKNEIKKDSQRWKNVDDYAKSVTADINNKFEEFAKSDKITEALGKALEKGVLSSSSNWSKKLANDKKEEKRNQDEIDKLEMDEIEEKSKKDAENYEAEQKRIKEEKKADEELRKKQWMLMLGKWGKLGVWGVVAQRVLHYVSAGVNYAYQTSMQGLDWQRTISGGASGGTWFGQGLAAYQRAGINRANYQNFKRGIQSYLGQVKLGTGNAAPLMRLGLNALDNPDQLEIQMERALRRLPEDVSLALAQQMGLDYNMWNAIYTGRIDRERSMYSPEAMKAWERLANSLNDLITNLNTLFFNKLAPLADFTSRVLNNTVNTGSSWGTLVNTAGSFANLFNPATLLGSMFANAIKFGSVEVVVKNERGDIIDTKYSQAAMEYNLGSTK